MGWNSEGDFVYDVYFVRDGLEVGMEGHCSVAAGDGGVSWWVGLGGMASRASGCCRFFRRAASTAEMTVEDGFQT